MQRYSDTISENSSVAILLMVLPIPLHDNIGLISRILAHHPFSLVHKT